MNITWTTECFPGSGPAQSVAELAARVVFAVQVLEPLTRDVCIDLRRTEITVPEEQLNDAQICATIQQMCCKRVA